MNSKQFYDIIGKIYQIGHTEVQLIEKRKDSYQKLTKNDDIIHIVYSNEAETTEKVLTKCRTIGIVNERNINIRNTNLANSNRLISTNGEHYLEMGSYIFDSSKIESPIAWKLVNIEGRMLYFISKYCLDFVSSDEINSLERQIRDKLQSDFKYVDEVYLLDTEFFNNNYEYIGNNIPSDYADSNRAQLLRLFWIRNSANHEQFATCNSNNVIIHQNFNLKNINCGVRFVVVIDDEKIKGE